MAGEILLLILLAVLIVMAVWVYNDAKERGNNAPFWVLLTLILGIIGLVLYLIMRNPDTDVIREQVRAVLDEEQ